MTTTFKALTPNLMVSDVLQSVEFYTKHFGFTLTMAVSDTKKTFCKEIPAGAKIIFAMIKNGNAELMLQLEESLKEDLPALQDTSIGSSISLYVHAENLEKLYDSVKGKVEVIKEFHTTWYGVNEFYIRDNNGYVVAFGEEENALEA